MVNHVFDQDILKSAIWYFNERERVRQKREAGEPKPWTQDSTLQQFSFTNILRRHDKTSQHFINKHYTPNFSCSFGEAVVNAAALRYFGSIAFSEEHSWITDSVIRNPEGMASDLYATVDRVISKGEKPFTSAYVITNMGLRLPKVQVVIERFLVPLALEIENLEYLYVHNPKKWRPLAEYMIKNLMGFADFTTKEVLQDVVYTNILEGYTDCNEWTPVGPGAQRGVNRLLGEPLTSRKGRDLEYMKALRTILMDNAEPHMQTILPEFDLHAVQFMCCEFDKLLRVRNGEGRPKKKYKGV